jgi:hypothetical protein
MATKKKDEIIKKLTELKPNVPTSSRQNQPTKKRQTAPIPVVMPQVSATENPPETPTTEHEQPERDFDFFNDNFASFEAVSNVVTDDSRKFFAFYFQTWQKLLGIYSEFLVNNLAFFMKFLFAKK